MLKVKIERYLNDFCRKDETKSFDDLIKLEDWMFGQMQQKHSEGMRFPTPEAAERIGEKGPWRIEFRPVRGEATIWIHQIETPCGIIFSDGRYTSGQRHWTEEVQEWLVHCEQRCKNPKFNFVGDNEPPKRSLWLRLGVMVRITAEEEAAIFGEDENGQRRHLRISSGVESSPHRETATSLTRWLSSSIRTTAQITPYETTILKCERYDT